MSNEILDLDTGLPLKGSHNMSDLHRMIKTVELTVLNILWAYGPTPKYMPKIKRYTRIYAKLIQLFRQWDSDNINLQIRARAGRDKGFRAYIRGIIGQRAITAWLRRAQREPDGDQPATPQPPAARKMRPHDNRAPISYIWKAYGLFPLCGALTRARARVALTTSHTRPRVSRGMPPALFYPYELEPDYEQTPDIASPKVTLPNPSSETGLAAKADKDKRTVANKNFRKNWHPP